MRPTTTVSAQIHALEDRIGEKVFIKVGRRLQLTETGHVVFRYADDIFRLVLAPSLRLLANDRIELSAPAAELDAWTWTGLADAAWTEAFDRDVWQCSRRTGLPCRHDFPLPCLRTRL